VHGSLNTAGVHVLLTYFFAASASILEPTVVIKVGCRLLRCFITSD